MKSKHFLPFRLSLDVLGLCRILDQDLVPPAKSLLYACGRIEVPELDRVKEQLSYKFGKDFADVNSDIGKASVDPSLIVKLSIRTPDAMLVNRYMSTIAHIFAVPWVEPEEQAKVEVPQSSVAMGPVCDYGLPPPPYTPPGGRDELFSSTGNVTPPAHPISTLDNGNGGVPGFAELTKRFQALKGDHHP